MCDPVDEWVCSHLSELDGKPLKSVLHGDLDLPGGEDSATEAGSDKEDSEDHDELIKKLKGALGETVKDVRTTARLTSSPACLVSDEDEMSANLERILKASGQEVPSTKRILEVNPSHPIVHRLDAETDEEKLQNWATMLHEQALLAEGGRLENPAAFVNRMNEMLLELSDATPVQ